MVCRNPSSAVLWPFIWNLLLITACTAYAVKTRNLPENFNEAKFIGFTMYGPLYFLVKMVFRYCTLVVWVAFLVLFAGTSNKALTMSLSFSLSASIALILLFFPKLFIIILHPEKNVRASYTTTKLIRYGPSRLVSTPFRCHFGNSQAAYESTKQHLSSKTTRTSMQSESVRWVVFPLKGRGSSARLSSCAPSFIHLVCTGPPPPSRLPSAAEVSPGRRLFTCPPSPTRRCPTRTRPHRRICLVGEVASREVSPLLDGRNSPPWMKTWHSSWRRVGDIR